MEADRQHLILKDAEAIRKEVSHLRQFVRAPRFGPRRKTREKALTDGLAFLDQVASDMWAHAIDVKDYV